MNRPEIIVYRDEDEQVCISMNNGRTYAVLIQWDECEHCYPESVGAILVSPPHIVGIGDVLHEVWRSGSES